MKFNRITPKDALWFVIAIWVIFVIDALLIGVNFNGLGIRPRRLYGLSGIFFSPFLHANLYHLISNSIPLLVLGFMINLSVGPKQLRIIMIFGAIGSGIGVWLFGANGVTIGASGLVFALIGFLFFDAYFNPSLRSWLFAILSFFAYGSTLLSLARFLPSISWAAHFWGFVSGILLAYGLSKWRKAREP